MEKTDATTMVDVIKDIDMRLCLDKAILRDQCYDGCRTMMGKKKGVATFIKRDVQALALSTHCYAHSLNLTCGDWVGNSTVVSNSFDTSYEITKLVKFSPKRDSHLRKIHEEEYYENEEKLSGKMQTLRLFGQIRWTVSASSLTSICKNYEELKELWSWCLVEYKDREAKARIHGVQAQMRTYDYFFGLRLGILLLRHRDNLSTSLQAENVCTAEAQKIAKSTANTLKKMRSDKKFNLFWKDVKNKAAIFDVDPPKFPRKKRAPARTEECLGGGAEPEFEKDVVSHYRKIYYDSLDCIINAIKDQFNQEDFKTYIKLENLLLKAAEGSDFDGECNDVMALYDSNFDGIRFQVQLKTLSEYCKEIVDTASVRTVTEVFRYLVVRNHLCEVHKLAKLIMVMPATNFTSERTFSLLKLIKIYLRFTMTQGRLNHLMILSGYRNRLDEMDLKKCRINFCSKK